MKTKKILLSIPEYLFKEIAMLQPYIASTYTGTIVQMLERGSNYYWKEVSKKRKAGILPAKTVDQNNPEESLNYSPEVVNARWVPED